jgi:hypothetical protein
MKENRPRLCRDCKHCLSIRDVEAVMAFCNNPRTKDSEHPIGFLSRGAKACDFYEAVGRCGTIPVPESREDWEPRRLLQRKEHGV